MSNNLKSGQVRMTEDGPAKPLTAMEEVARLWRLHGAVVSTDGCIFVPAPPKETK